MFTQIHEIVNLQNQLPENSNLQVVYVVYNILKSKSFLSRSNDTCLKISVDTIHIGQPICTRYMRIPLHHFSVVAVLDQIANIG